MDQAVIKRHECTPLCLRRDKQVGIVRIDAELGRQTECRIEIHVEESQRDAMVDCQRLSRLLQADPPSLEHGGECVTHLPWARWEALRFRPGFQAGPYAAYTSLARSSSSG